MSEPNWLEELGRLRALKADLDTLILQSVKGARKAGMSWYDIGPAMGVTRQAACEKFNPLMPAHLQGRLNRSKVKA